ncbi:MAG: hypothetical protein ACLU4N_11195 [Butyricimonas faecihominis]
MVLIFNFIGMASQTITVTIRGVNVVLKEDLVSWKMSWLPVITRRLKMPTRELTTVKEDLLKVSPTNLIQALASLVPGLRIVENNEQGPIRMRFPRF